MGTKPKGVYVSHAGSQRMGRRKRARRWAWRDRKLQRRLDKALKGAGHGEAMGN